MGVCGCYGRFGRFWAFLAFLGVLGKTTVFFGDLAEVPKKLCFLAALRALLGFLGIFRCFWVFLCVLGVFERLAKTAFGDLAEAVVVTSKQARKQAQ